jgi:hypothetical protein
LSYGHPTSFGTFGVSALRLGGGKQEGRDELRRPTGEFSADDIAALVSYSTVLPFSKEPAQARPLSTSTGGRASRSAGSYVGVGANVKYLRSRIATESADTFAVDAGAVGRLPGLPIRLGAAVLNVGSGLRFIDQVDRLPLKFSLGGLWQPARPLILALDFTHEPYDDRSTLHLGAQYSLTVFDFRGGYEQIVRGEKDKSLSVAEHLRGGLGIRFSRYRADYTLAPFGDLGLTQRFTLSMRFGPGSTEDERHNLQNPDRDAGLLMDVPLAGSF